MGTNNTTFRVIQSVAHKWESVALQLEIPEAVIKTLDRDIKDSEVKCAKIFEKWLDGGYLKPVTWEALLEILTDVEFSTLAKDLKQFALKQ